MYDHLCIRLLAVSLGSVIVRNRHLKFLIPIVWIWQAAENTDFFFFFFFFFFFVGKWLKMIQKVHGGDIKHAYMSKNKNRQNGRWVIFCPCICQLQLPISQNRPLRLVPFCWSASHLWLLWKKLKKKKTKRTNILCHHPTTALFCQGGHLDLVWDRVSCSNLKTLPIFKDHFSRNVPICRDFSQNGGPFFKIFGCSP